MDTSIVNIRYNLIKFVSLFHRLFTPSFKKEVDNKYNCTKNQVRAIMILGKKEKISPTLLGQCMDMEKGSITTLINSMENMDLVYREDDSIDKRKTWIKLTEEGRNYYLRQEAMFIDRIKKLFINLSEDEVNEFNNCLKTIVEILEKVRND